MLARETNLKKEEKPICSNSQREIRRRRKERRRKRLTEFFCFFSSTLYFVAFRRGVSKSSPQHQALYRGARLLRTMLNADIAVFRTRCAVPAWPTRSTRPRLMQTSARIPDKKRPDKRVRIKRGPLYCTSFFSSFPLRRNWRTNPGINDNSRVEQLCNYPEIYGTEMFPFRLFFSSPQLHPKILSSSLHDAHWKRPNR